MLVVDLRCRARSGIYRVGKELLRRVSSLVDTCAVANPADVEDLTQFKTDSNLTFSVASETVDEVVWDSSVSHLISAGYHFHGTIPPHVTAGFHLYDLLAFSQNAKMLFGPDVSEVRSKIESSLARADWVFSTDPQLLLNSKMLISEGFQARLLQLYPTHLMSIRQSRLDGPPTFVGRRRAHKFSSQEIDDLGRRGVIHIDCDVAYIPDREYYLQLANSKAIICTSTSEGFGYPVAEALCLNVPVATTSVVPSLKGFESAIHLLRFAEQSEEYFDLVRPLQLDHELDLKLVAREASAMSTLTEFLEHAR
jgi:hypothetical protein